MQILSPDGIAYGASRFLDPTHTSPTHRMSMSGPGLTSPASSDSGPEEAARNAGQVVDHSAGGIASHSPPHSDGPSPRDGESGEDSLRLSRSFPGSVGYLANRWNPGSSFSTPSTLGHGAGDDSIK
jgi:hypothetical protein